MTNRIEQTLKLAGKTRQDLEQATGISQGHLSKIIRGVHSPSVRQARALADALDVPIDYLFPKQELPA